MELNEFVAHFAEQFEETDTTNFTGETDFRANEEWSSLIGLSIIAMVDEKYHKTLTGEQLKKAKLVKDIIGMME